MDIFRKEFEKQMFELMEVKLLEYLLNFKYFLLAKIDSVKKSTHHKYSKIEQYQNLNKHSLCCNDQVIQSMLEQEFERQKLGYYNYLGVEVKKQFLTIEIKYSLYRFQNYEKRLEFVENLIKELDK